MTDRRVSLWCRGVLAGLFVLAMGFVAQPKPDPAAAGAGRFSENVAVIRVEGIIDAITAASMTRRIHEAEQSNADALVIEINSPGGAVGAVLEITAALKRTRIPRTVAWVNPQAYSGGAILALACQTIVVSDASVLGDAAPVLIADSPNPFGPGKHMIQVQATERAKMLTPLLTEVVGSARKNGYDEKLVQGMVTLGVELWLVENAATGEWLFIDRDEYRMLFDGDPVTSRPRLAAPSDSIGARPQADAGPPVSPVQRPNNTDLVPAGRMDPKLVRDASFGLDQPTKRPQITPADKGNWRLIEYVATGKGLITMTGEDMLHFKMAAATVNTPDELKAYLHATNVVVQPLAWYEAAAAAMSSMWIRGLLVVIVILGLFIEFVHPGLILPGSVAGLALVALLLPEMLMGLAGWWEVAAILAGIVLIALELFVLPGFGVFGAVGLLLLFGGLVMTFAHSTGGLFPGSGSSDAGVLYGVAFVLLGIVTAGVAMYYLSKSTRGLPVFNRLVLRSAGGPDVDSAAVVAEMLDAAAKVGDVGVVISTLRPAGKIEVEGRIVDVVSDSGYVAPGERVRVMLVEQMRVVVERV